MTSSLPAPDPVVDGYVVVPASLRSGIFSVAQYAVISDSATVPAKLGDQTGTTEFGFAA